MQPIYARCLNLAIQADIIAKVDKNNRYYIIRGGHTAKKGIIMKKVIKSVIALAMAAVMVMALAACSGSAKDKMKGDWIYEKIAGETVADYAAKLGVDESSFASVWTFTDDKVIIKSAAATEEHNVQYKSNGAEVMEVGSTDKIQMSVKLENDKLSFKLKGTDGKEYDYVMKKGTMEVGSSTAVKE